MSDDLLGPDGAPSTLWHFTGLALAERQQAYTEATCSAIRAKIDEYTPQTPMLNLLARYAAVVRASIRHTLLANDLRASAQVARAGPHAYSDERPHTHGNPVLPTSLERLAGTEETWRVAPMGLPDNPTTFSSRQDDRRLLLCNSAARTTPAFWCMERNDPDELQLVFAAKPRTN